MSQGVGGGFSFTPSQMNEDVSYPELGMEGGTQKGKRNKNNFRANQYYRQNKMYLNNKKNK
jgi:hypothetical protein